MSPLNPSLLLRSLLVWLYAQQFCHRVPDSRRPLRRLFKLCFTPRLYDFFIIENVYTSEVFPFGKDDVYSLVWVDHATAKSGALEPYGFESHLWPLIKNSADFLQPKKRFGYFAASGKVTRPSAFGASGEQRLLNTAL